ncbi:hypothetical protein KIN20_032210 [Parelaphostrongylus tenuis]|uniref:Uncharacterized protein n=1 Tax=Parelaphostrongylus tenuis TaxID=148309 RepID=A0AAD5R695_PARTN|nr:hypothetical protein KIN20_032210 [Parelaphostrongylus tenuis]
MAALRRLSQSAALRLRIWTLCKSRDFLLSLAVMPWDRNRATDLRRKKCKDYNQLKVTSPTSSVTSLILFESKASGLCPILVTVAYLALSYLFMVLVNLGDENLITDPAYDSYASQVVVADDVPIYCVLSVSDQDRTTSDFRFGIGQLLAKCSNSAKAIVSNNPKSNG